MFSIRIECASSKHIASLADMPAEVARRSSTPDTCDGPRGSAPEKFEHRLQCENGAHVARVQFLQALRSSRKHVGGDRCALVDAGDHSPVLPRMLHGPILGEVVGNAPILRLDGGPRRRRGEPPVALPHVRPVRSEIPQVSLGSHDTKAGQVLQQLQRGFLLVQAAVKQRTNRWSKRSCGVCGERRAPVQGGVVVENSEHAILRADANHVVIPDYGQVAVAFLLRPQRHGPVSVRDENDIRLAELRASAKVPHVFLAVACGIGVPRPV
mmetsp:Transcript_72903/g.202287  ORF Transcript_72903/g.202287 Transcript_72903/m.202287 type:complete len:268 (+) Transcript_72903:28-831(+)